MKKIIAVAITLACVGFISFPAQAGEHPSEHPAAAKEKLTLKQPSSELPLTDQTGKEETMEQPSTEQPSADKEKNGEHSSTEHPSTEHPSSEHPN